MLSIARRLVGTLPRSVVFHGRHSPAFLPFGVTCCNLHKKFTGKQSTETSFGTGKQSKQTSFSRVKQSKSTSFNTEKQLKQTSFSARKQSRERYFEDEDEAELTGTLEDLEDFHDVLEKQMQKPEFAEKMHKEKTRFDTVVKRKIIERKYFKQEQELNLLTWDAKEQIRYLHAEFPEEWTVERLVESFPISRDGLIRLLRSRFQPGSFEEVVKHDERVQNHWKMLKDGQPNVHSRYLQLIEAVKQKNVQLGANLSLPMPNSKWKDSSEKREFNVRNGKFLSTEPGRFELIVKEYCEKKKRAEEKDSNSNFSEINKQKFEEKSRRTRELVEIPNGGKNSKPLNFEPHPNDMQVQAGDRQSKTVRHNSRDDPDLPSKSNPYNRHSRLWNDTDIHNRKSSDNRIPKISKSLEEIANLNNADHLKEMEVENLKLLKSRQRTKYAVDENRENFVKNLAVEDEKSAEVYAYDEKSGYRYPFGRQKNNPDEKISVPEETTSPETVYRRGKDFYDADGTFLYRIP